MDSGAWALVAVGVLGLIGTVVTVRGTRRTDKDKVDVQQDEIGVTSFEANIRAFTLRAKNAEERADAAEKKADALAERVGALEEKDEVRDRQLNRIRLIVQTWFRDLHAAWPNDHTMPLPSAEDLEVLGITIPKFKQTDQRKP